MACILLQVSCEKAYLGKVGTGKDRHIRGGLEDPGDLAVEQFNLANQMLP